MLAGVVAGVPWFLFARTFAEPAIGLAIDFEDTHNPAGHDHGVELRGDQQDQRAEPDQAQCGDRGGQGAELPPVPPSTGPNHPTKYIERRW